MSIDLVKSVNEQYKNDSIPDMKVGQNARVHIKVKEGARERIQVYEGVIISIKGKGKNKRMFTVRRVTFGVGVERIFPINSKIIDKIEIVRTGKTRRAKLYYLRKTTSKGSKLKEIKNF